LDKPIGENLRLVGSAPKKGTFEQYGY